MHFNQKSAHKETKEAIFDWIFFAVIPFVYILVNLIHSCILAIFKSSVFYVEKKKKKQSNVIDTNQVCLVCLFVFTTSSLC